MLIELIIIIVAVFTLFAVWIITFFLGRTSLKNLRTYNSLVFSAEHQPLRDFSAAEMAVLAARRVSFPYAVALVDLAVNHNIVIIKNPYRPTGSPWRIRIQNLDGITAEGMTLLKLLSGAAALNLGAEFDLRPIRSNEFASVTLTEYQTIIKNHLEATNMIDNKKRRSVIGLYYLFWLSFCPLLFALYQYYIHQALPFNEVVKFLAPILLGLYLFTFLIYPIISARIYKFSAYTESGLRTARYLDGIKLYLKMSDKARLDFNQKLDNINHTGLGTTYLYEKLLPYAFLFRLDRHWVGLITHYYRANSTSTPEWYEKPGAKSTLTPRFFAGELRDFVLYVEGLILP